MTAIRASRSACGHAAVSRNSAAVHGRPAVSPAAASGELPISKATTASIEQNEQRSAGDVIDGVLAGKSNAL